MEWERLDLIWRTHWCVGWKKHGIPIKIDVWCWCCWSKDQWARLPLVRIIKLAVEIALCVPVSNLQTFKFVDSYITKKVPDTLRRPLLIATVMRGEIIQSALGRFLLLLLMAVTYSSQCNSCLHVLRSHWNMQFRLVMIFFLSNNMKSCHSDLVSTTHTCT